jgi:cytochrome P450
VAVADLNAFRAIHKIGMGFNKSQWYLSFTDTSGPGIFAMTDPKQHAARRRLFAQSFANSSIMKYESLVRTKVDMAISLINRDASKGNADILKWFTFMATDLAGQLFFGKSFGMLQKGEVSNAKSSQYVLSSDTPSSERSIYPRFSGSHDDIGHSQ